MRLPRGLWRHGRRLCESSNRQGGDTCDDSNELNFHGFVWLNRLVFLLLMLMLLLALVTAFAYAVEQQQEQEQD